MVARDQLTSDDERLLEHVHRFRITTPQVLHKLFYPQANLEDVRYHYRRLRRAGCLGLAGLYFQQPYYYLLPEAARELFSERDAGPLDPQRIVDAFAMLAFCCLDGAPRERLSIRHFADTFPDLLKPHPPWYGYYVDAEDQKTRLGFVKVDRGFNYERSALYLHRIVKDRTACSPWKAVIDHDDFIVTFLTAWPSKADRIRQVLAAKAQPAPWRVHVIEDLRHLISRRTKEL